MGAGLSYQLGDEVMWLRDDSGSIVAPNVYLLQDSGNAVWNCGDPTAPAAMIFDWEWYGFNDAPIPCASCGAPIRGLAVVVDRGRFVEARAVGGDEAHLLLGVLDGKVDVLTGPTPHQWTPRPDLYDSPALELIEHGEKVPERWLLPSQSE